MESLAFRVLPKILSFDPSRPSSSHQRRHGQPTISSLRRRHCQLRSAHTGPIAISSSYVPKDLAAETYGTTQMLPFATSLQEAKDSLKSCISSIPPPLSSTGVLRVEVPVSSNIKALDWLQSQPSSLPQFYYSPRECYDDLKFSEVSRNVACIGSAMAFKGMEPFSTKDWNSIHRFLPKKCPQVRAYGAMRFNPNMQASPEWEPFGTFFFFIPQIEFGETKESCVLAANLIWGEGVTFNNALDELLSALSKVCVDVQATSPFPQTTVLQKRYTPDKEWWSPELGRVVAVLQDGQKVVMARRTEVEVTGDLKPLSILSAFQKYDLESYQFCLKLPDGSCFLGNTPEQLFARNGDTITSDAVAGTRHRGSSFENDHDQRLDLLQSPKDGIEFEVAENRIRSCLQTVCKNMTTPIKRGILKQHRVQHMHTLFMGQLEDNYQESDLLAAVYPASYAKKAPITEDAFDRGMYSGPVGWFGSEGAEFAVGLRSALILPSEDNSKNAHIFVYAGVGVVKGSTAEAEWRELNLKTGQFDMLLQPKCLN